MRFPVAVAGLLMGLTSLSSLAQGVSTSNIVVVEGEGAINNISQRTAWETIVQVEDQNHKLAAVAGAAAMRGALADTRRASSNGNLTIAPITISLGTSMIGAPR